MKKQDFEVVKADTSYHLYYKNEYLDNFSLENESRLFPSTERLLRIEFNVGYSTNIEHWCIDNFYNEPVAIPSNTYLVEHSNPNSYPTYTLYLDGIPIDSFGVLSLVDIIADALRDYFKLHEDTNLEQWLLDNLEVREDNE